MVEDSERLRTLRLSQQNQFFWVACLISRSKTSAAANGIFLLLSSALG